MDEVKTIARQWFERVWQEKDAEAIDELLHPEIVAHQPGDRRSDRKEFRMFHAQILEAVPDYRLEIEDVIADGDQAAVRWRMTGTHAGAPFAGIEPKEARVEIPGLTWFTIRDDRIVEGWDGWDYTGVLATLRGEAG